MTNQNTNNQIDPQGVNLQWLPLMEQSQQNVDLNNLVPIEKALKQAYYHADSSQKPVISSIILTHGSIMTQLQEMRKTNLEQLQIIKELQQYKQRIKEQQHKKD